jgi:hypothetical protein
MFPAYRSGSASVPLGMQWDTTLLGVVHRSFSAMESLPLFTLRRGKQSSPARIKGVTSQCDFKLVPFNIIKMKRNLSLNTTNGLLAKMESSYVTTCFGLHLWPSSG